MAMHAPHALYTDSLNSCTDYLNGCTDCLNGYTDCFNGYTDCLNGCTAGGLTRFDGVLSPFMVDMQSELGCILHGTNR